MAAEKQFRDAKLALKIIEDQVLPDSKYLTYGSLAEQLGYTRTSHARHVGQVCSLIDAACFLSELPSLSIEKVRKNDNSYNIKSFSGSYAAIKDKLVANSATRAWSSDDIARLIACLDSGMNGSCAVLQWKAIESRGDAFLMRILNFK